MVMWELRCKSISSNLFTDLGCNMLSIEARKFRIGNPSTKIQFIQAVNSLEISKILALFIFCQKLSKFWCIFFSYKFSTSQCSNCMKILVFYIYMSDRILILLEVMISFIFIKLILNINNLAQKLILMYHTVILLLAPCLSTKLRPLSHIIVLLDFKESRITHFQMSYFFQHNISCSPCARNC